MIAHKLCWLWTSWRSQTPDENLAASNFCISRKRTAGEIMFWPRGVLLGCLLMCVDTGEQHPLSGPGSLRRQTLFDFISQPLNQQRQVFLSRCALCLFRPQLMSLRVLYTSLILSIFIYASDSSWGIPLLHQSADNKMLPFNYLLPAFVASFFWLKSKQSLWTEAEEHQVLQASTVSKMKGHVLLCWLWWSIHYISHKKKAMLNDLCWDSSILMQRIVEKLTVRLNSTNNWIQALCSSCLLCSSS